MSQVNPVAKSNNDYIHDPEFNTLLVKFRDQCLKLLNAKHLIVLIVGIGQDCIEYYTIGLTDKRFHLKRTYKTKYTEQLMHYLTHMGLPKNEGIEPPVNFNFKPLYDYFLIGTEAVRQII